MAEQKDIQKEKPLEKVTEEEAPSENIDEEKASDWKKTVYTREHIYETNEAVPEGERDNYGI